MGLQRTCSVARTCLFGVELTHMSCSPLMIALANAALAPSHLKDGLVRPSRPSQTKSVWTGLVFDCPRHHRRGRTGTTLGGGAYGAYKFATSGGADKDPAS
jgi:hypothetical protein